MNSAQPYDQAFYDSQMAESLQSARIYLSHLREFYQPASVLDAGCGRGMWLKAAGELGSTRLYGLDGPWNRQELMIDPSIAFTAVDLDQAFSAGPVDLALSLEVAEHLAPASADTFVASLCSTADAVMFGAAYPGQGGTQHINEQPPSYWAARFASHGFDSYDLFRPALWSDVRIPYWYRQNTFFYTRRGSSAHTQLAQSGAKPAAPGFLDCVHPDMYALALQSLRHAEQPAPFSQHVRGLFLSFARAVKRRLEAAG